MGKAKIAITIDKGCIGELDRLVDAHFYQKRRQASPDELIHAIDGLNEIIA
jgi:hypothetical protein